MKQLLLFFFSFVLMSSCGSNDNDIRPADIIVGNWTIEKYELEPEDDELEITLSNMVCDAANHFTVYTRYDDVAYEGTYEIGDDYIRLEYVDEDGKAQKILAQILDYSENTLVITYKYEDSKQDIKLTLWLKK